MWEQIVSHFKNYMGGGFILLLYFVCLIWMFIKEERKERRILFIYMPLVVSLIFFNPLMSRLMTKMAEDEIYYRLLWILPVSITLAYSITQICIRLKGVGRAVALGLFVAVLAIGGKFIYDDAEYSVAENEYHLPQAVVDLCDEIAVPGYEVIAAFPKDMLVYVRQYTSLIRMPYGYEEIKYATMKYVDEILAEVEAAEPNAEKLFGNAYQRGVQFIVLSEQQRLDDDPQKHGFEIYKRVDGYIVYKQINLELWGGLKI